MISLKVTTLIAYLKWLFIYMIFPKDIINSYFGSFHKFYISLINFIMGVYKYSTKKKIFNDLSYCNSTCLILLNV